MICIAFCQTNHLFIFLVRAEKEICFSMANGTFKIKMDIVRHGPRLMPNNCKVLNPPNFSLPSTFKGYHPKKTAEKTFVCRRANKLQQIFLQTFFKEKQTNALYLYS